MMQKIAYVSFLKLKFVLQLFVAFVCLEIRYSHLFVFGFMMTTLSFRLI